MNVDFVLSPLIAVGVLEAEMSVCPEEKLNLLVPMDLITVDMTIGSSTSLNVKESLEVSNLICY